MLEARLRGLKERNAQAQLVIEQTGTEIADLEMRIEDIRSRCERPNGGTQCENEHLNLLLQYCPECPLETARDLAKKLADAKLDKSLLRTICAPNLLASTCTELKLVLGERSILPNSPKPISKAHKLSLALLPLLNKKSMLIKFILKHLQLRIFSFSVQFRLLFLVIFYSVKIWF